jgi:hypothetical protein
VVPRKRSAPVVEDLDQSAHSNVLSDLVLEQESEAEPFRSAPEPEVRVVDDQRPVNPDAQLPAILLELPRVEAAAGRQADVEAAVLRQVVRVRGIGCLAK